jgi:hypothetical protein
MSIPLPKLFGPWAWVMGAKKMEEINAIKTKTG